MANNLQMFQQSVQTESIQGLKNSATSAQTTTDPTQPSRRVQLNAFRDISEQFGQQGSF